MKKTLAIIVTASTVLIAGTLGVRSLTEKRIEKVDGNVKIVTTELVEQLPVSAEPRVAEALDRVARVEEWLNQIEERESVRDARITALEVKAGITKPIEAETLIENPK